VLFRQGYLSTEKTRTVRVRLEGDRGVLTVKGLTRGVTRLEFEYEIPAADAARMLDDLCERPLIEKTRYRIDTGRHVWEVDEFHGDNEGLVVAEIELAAADEVFDRPAWIGREVSDDPRYFNANLVAHPYRSWS
jgi:CYTH domain-containing protein